MEDLAGKLLLVVAIKKAEGILGKMVMDEQLLMGWPGLCQDVSRICDTNWPAGRLPGGRGQDGDKGSYILAPLCSNEGRNRAS